MSEKKIKVGDRVRFIGDYTHYVEEALKNGEVYTISNIDDWGVELSVPMESHVDAEYLELVEPTDPRTAFLRELKELLRKYDASIASAAVYADDYWVEAYMGNNLVASTEGKSVDFTSDNIMDYEK